MGSLPTANVLLFANTSSRSVRSRVQLVAYHMTCGEEVTGQTDRSNIQPDLRQGWEQITKFILFYLSRLPI